MLHRRGFFDPPAPPARGRPPAAWLRPRALPLGTLVGGLVLVALSSGQPRSPGLLALGVTCAVAGTGSLVHPPLLWAIGPVRHRLSRTERIVGAVMFAVALAAGIMVPLILG